MHDKDLNERAQLLLHSLITKYIEDGKPVGSQTLARSIDMDISSATIRNVMAELEHRGYVASPHTSAGRVPTHKGYRFFVNSLMHMEDVLHREMSEIEAILEGSLNLEGRDVAGFLDTASHILSKLTKMAGVVSLPRRQKLILKHVEFLPVGKDKILVILVTNEYEVENKVIQTEREYSASELEQASNYINSQFQGQDLMSARQNLLSELQDHRRHLDGMMSASLELAQKVFKPVKEGKNDYLLHGQNRLFQWNDSADMDKMRRIFDAFNEKQMILRLLDQSIGAEGVQIFIGNECGYEEMQELSLVTSPYQEGGMVIGVLGVIGPTRMNYERIIPVVDLTAKILTSALNQLK